MQPLVKNPLMDYYEHKVLLSNGNVSGIPFGEWTPREFSCIYADFYTVDSIMPKLPTPYGMLMDTISFLDGK